MFALGCGPREQQASTIPASVSPASTRVAARGSRWAVRRQGRTERAHQVGRETACGPPGTAHAGPGGGVPVASAPGVAGTWVLVPAVLSCNGQSLSFSGPLSTIFSSPFQNPASHDEVVQIKSAHVKETQNSRGRRVIKMHFGRVEILCTICKRGFPTLACL